MSESELRLWQATQIKYDALYALFEDIQERATKVDQCVFCLDAEITPGLGSNCVKACKLYKRTGKYCTDADPYKKFCFALDNLDTSFTEIIDWITKRVKECEDEQKTPCKRDTAKLKQE